MINLLDYFDVELSWVEDVPKIKMKLKDYLKENKNPIFKPTGQPYSGATIEYFLNYLGDDLGPKVYEERRKLFPKQSLIKWYINNFECTDFEIEKMNTHLENISKKLTNALINRYNGEFGLENRQKQSQNVKKYAKKVGKINSEKWKDPDFYNRMMSIRNELNVYDRVSKKCKEKYSDPVFKQWFIERVNHPDRVEKIRKHSLEMWRQFKEGESDRYLSTINSGNVKKFNLNGVNMNMIEFLVGQILNTLNLNWQYNKFFNLNGKIYLPDFYIEDKKLIIECFGDYWHANPRKYNSDSIIHSNKKASEFWEYDLKRKNLFESNNFIFLVLWENEIINNEEYCKQEILKFI